MALSNEYYSNSYGLSIKIEVLQVYILTGPS